MLFYNPNAQYGPPGPFEAESKQEVADMFDGHFREVAEQDWIVADSGGLTREEWIERCVSNYKDEYADELVVLPEGLGESLRKFEALVKIQVSKGNYDFDPYMHGMANGMILASAILRGETPLYLEAPDRWISDSREKLLRKNGELVSRTIDGEETAVKVAESQPRLNEVCKLLNESVLPMMIGDGSEVFISAMSGVQDEVEGLPRMMTLVWRKRGETERRADYIVDRKSIRYLSIDVSKGRSRAVVHCPDCGGEMGPYSEAMLACMECAQLLEVDQAPASPPVVKGVPEK
jgi:hypothetical protein